MANQYTKRKEEAAKAATFGMSVPFNGQDDPISDAISSPEVQARAQRNRQEQERLVGEVLSAPFSGKRPTLANNPWAAAVPDSRNFGDPEAPEFPPYLVGKHVGGIPCEQLPPEMVAALSIQHTDEDIAERNAGKAEPGSGAREVRGPREHAIQKFGDKRREHWGVPAEQLNHDPLELIKRQYCPPGYRIKFFNPKSDAATWAGYQPVLDDKGDAVKFGEMPAGIIPAELAERFNRAAEDKSRQQIGAIHGTLIEEQKELARQGLGSAANVITEEGETGLREEYAT